MFWTAGPNSNTCYTYIKFGLVQFGYVMAHFKSEPNLFGVCSFLVFNGSFRINPDWLFDFQNRHNALIIYY